MTPARVWRKLLLVSTGHNATVIGGDGATVTTMPMPSWSPLRWARSDGSKLVLVPDAPHGLNVTHAQTFNAEVLAFLRG